MNETTGNQEWENLSFDIFCTECGRKLPLTAKGCVCDDCLRRERDAEDRRRKRYYCVNYQAENITCVLNQHNCTCPALGCFKKLL
ncbi:hypothetical protein Dip510_000049 [Elusimicrobium posterum]|uniref:hypothetical protein n=1 Tax=Elusimicrobium posterum TaxID=3116653 RepID=UPI003C754CE7